MINRPNWQEVFANHLAGWTLVDVQPGVDDEDDPKLNFVLADVTGHLVPPDDAYCHLLSDLVRLVVYCAAVCDLAQVPGEIGTLAVGFAFLSPCD